MSWNAIVDLCRRRKWPECIKTWKQKITRSRFRGNISYRFVIIIYHPSASQRIRFISISHPSWKPIPTDENAVRLTRQPSFSLLTAVSREQGKRAKNSLETKSWPIRLANVATFQRILNRWDWWNRRDGNNEWRVTCIGTEQSFETTWNIVSQYRVDFSGKTGNAGKINFTFYYTALSQPDPDVKIISHEWNHELELVYFQSWFPRRTSRNSTGRNKRWFRIPILNSVTWICFDTISKIDDPFLVEYYINLIEDVFSFSWQSFNDKRAESIDRYFRIERAVSRWKDRLSSYLVLEEHLRKRNQIVYESETLHNVESSFEDIFW